MLVETRTAMGLLPVSPVIEARSLGGLIPSALHQLRVYSVLEVLKEEVYQPPIVCSVPEEKIISVLDCESEFDPSKSPLKEIDPRNPSY